MHCPTSLAHSPSPMTSRLSFCPTSCRREGLMTRLLFGKPVIFHWPPAVSLDSNFPQWSCPVVPGSCPGNLGSEVYLNFICLTQWITANTIWALRAKFPMARCNKELHHYALDPEHNYFASSFGWIIHSSRSSVQSHFWGLPSKQHCRSPQKELGCGLMR